VVAYFTKRASSWRYH